MPSPDADLVVAALADPEAFDAIIERYERPLISFILSRGSLSRVDAEDLAQQVFIKSYEHLNDFDPEMKLSTWLFAIARNEVISNWRKQEARPTEQEMDAELVDTYQHIAAEMATVFDAKLTATHVRELLLQLKPDYRDALYLFYFQEKKYDEIADILRRPPGTVATLISRAKKAFAALAQQQGIAHTFTTDA